MSKIKLTGKFVKISNVDIEQKLKDYVDRLTEAFEIIDAVYYEIEDDKELRKIELNREGENGEYISNITELLSVSAYECEEAVNAFKKKIKTL